MEKKQKLIDQFEKNSVEKVKVHLEEWKGKTYVDIRIWFSEKAGENGAERPTHKGITLNAELLPELRKAIDKALVMFELGEGKELKLELEEGQDRAGIIEPRQSNDDNSQGEK